MARINRKSLLRQLAEAHAAADAAAAKLDELKVMARELLPMGKSSEDIDGATIVVELRPNRRWNKDKAAENYGESIMSMQVDQTLARRKLTGDEYEALYVEGAPAVVIKVV